jgi:hypothetical protein
MQLTVTGKPLNLVCRRPDGNIGRIDPARRPAAR